MLFMLSKITSNIKYSNFYRNAFLVLLVFCFLFVSYQIFLKAPYDLFELLVFATYSVMRIAASYFFSLIAAIFLGFWMAKNRQVERILLPFLDIMQSVPVVGFFPAAIGIFVALFKGQRIGIELASIFLIFTSQAWNMIFGVYESLKVMPKDIERLLKAFNVRGWLALRKVYIPATIPSLVFNSNVSWGNSWFFLMTSEVFAIGAKQFELPGLGYILWKSSEKGDIYGVLGGFLVIIITVLAMSVFVWEPLTSWSKKFSFQMVPYAEEMPENFVLSKFRDMLQVFVPVRKNFEERLKKRLLKTTLTEKLAGFFFKSEIVAKLEKILSYLFKLLLLAFVLLLVYFSGKFAIFVFTNPFPKEALSIPLFTLYSLLRLVAVYVFCLSVVTVVLVMIYYGNRESTSILMTVLRILSSVPGTALKPLILSIVMGYSLPHSKEIVAFIVLFSTMIWYVIFPPASRIITLPRELREPVELYSRSKFFTLRKLILPASFPGLVTGSFAAFGAGWNALVVAEFSIFRHEVFKVDGIGYLIDYAAIIKGDTYLLALCLAFMVGFIIFLNRLVWQRLYDYAEKKYALELE